jgi:hypothetical protein
MLSENLKGRDCLRNLGVGGRIILKFILNKVVQEGACDGLNLQIRVSGDIFGQPSNSIL